MCCRSSTTQSYLADNDASWAFFGSKCKVELSVICEAVTRGLSEDVEWSCGWCVHTILCVLCYVGVRNKKLEGNAWVRSRVYRRGELYQMVVNPSLIIYISDIWIYAHIYGHFPPSTTRSVHTISVGSSFFASTQRLTPVTTKRWNGNVIDV